MKKTVATLNTDLPKKGCMFFYQKKYIRESPALNAWAPIFKNADLS